MARQDGSAVVYSEQDWPEKVPGSGMAAAVAAQGRLQDAHAFGDLGVVPSRAGLLVEGNECAVLVGARGPFAQQNSGSSLPMVVACEERQNGNVTNDPETVLAGKRAGLEAELDALTKPESDQGGISFGKRVGEGTTVAVERLSQVAAHDRLRAMLSAVTRAQAKLAEGTYGTCDRCGAAVAPERLEALPWATHCVGCAGKS